jgi:hypothetical protein
MAQAPASFWGKNPLRAAGIPECKPASFSWGPLRPPNACACALPCAACLSVPAIKKRALTTSRPADFAEWIKLDPPPSLQDLVAKWGGYQNILRGPWAEIDAARAEWEERRKRRLRRGE